jgi:hypothetical protein
LFISFNADSFFLMSELPFFDFFEFMTKSLLDLINNARIIYQVN